MAQDLVFVVGADPSQLKANAGSAREIKSHLARQAWKAFIRPEPKRRRGGRKQKPDPRTTVVTELAISDHGSWRSPDSDDASTIISNGGGEKLVKLPQIEYRLGGGRCDPFLAYPERDMPCVHPLVDHCEIAALLRDQPGSTMD
jgi:hypothetical protein